MSWKDIREVVPIWYEVVKAILKNGEEVLVWRASSDGENDYYTKYNSNQIFFEDEIEKWEEIDESDLPEFKIEYNE